MKKRLKKRNIATDLVMVLYCTVVGMLLVVVVVVVAMLLI